MKEYQKQSQTVRFFLWFNNHPGAAFSIAYAILTLSGIYYSYSFFAQFNVPVLKFATISDMLLVGFSEPAALLTFLGGLGIAVFTDAVQQLSFDTYRKWQAKPKGIIRTVVLLATYTPKTNFSVMAVFLFMFALYSMIFVSLYGEWRGEQVKSGKGEKVIVKADAISDKPVTFLGTTSTFVIVFDSNTNTSHIIPIEAVSLIQPVVEAEETKASN